jgi:hypothetical protein
MGFEPIITALEKAKTVHALDRAATVIGLYDLFSPLALEPQFGPWPTSMKLRFTSVL